jgi:hypothetical protein
VIQLGRAGYVIDALMSGSLAALVLWIATTNFFSRINATTRQPAPQDWG